MWDEAGEFEVLFGYPAFDWNFHANVLANRQRMPNPSGRACITRVLQGSFSGVTGKFVTSKAGVHPMDCSDTFTYSIALSIQPCFGQVHVL
jgi:hypothetical protein